MFRALHPIAVICILILTTFAAERPLNIVILYADDLGYGDLKSYHPDSKIPTPISTSLPSKVCASPTPTALRASLYFPLPSPHAPIVPNDEFDGTSKAGAYGDFVVETDHACGRLFTALREAGLYDNTIILFTADNGAEAYAYERDAKLDHWSSAPLRGLKRDIYEGGHRVPTILRWPGVTQSGSATTALFSQADLIATIAG